MIPVLLGTCFEGVRYTWNETARHRGGMKESGIGRENGLEAYEACTYSYSRVEHA